MGNSEPHITSTDMPYQFQYFNGLMELKDSLYCCNTEYGSEYELRFLYPDGNYEELGVYPEEVNLGLRMRWRVIRLIIVCWQLSLMELV